MYKCNYFKNVELFSLLLKDIVVINAEVNFMLLKLSLRIFKCKYNVTF